MTSVAQSAPVTVPGSRTASLASVFQEIFTAIVRVRFRLQQVEQAKTFRGQVQAVLHSTMQQARSLGYSSEHVRIAVFATVAFLDESVLNLQDPVFADWARRPLQEELFGGHLAGEAFFENMRMVLAEPESPEVADVLELHCLCLLMGYRGRYALGDSGQLFAMLRQARERIRRIRGEAHLAAPLIAAPAGIAVGPDRWSTRLLWITVALLVLALASFFGYQLSLSSGVTRLTASMHRQQSQQDHA